MSHSHEDRPPIIVNGNLPPDYASEREGFAREQLIELATKTFLPLGVRKHEQVGQTDGTTLATKPAGFDGVEGSRFYYYEMGSTDEAVAATIALYNPERDVTAEVLIKLDGRLPEPDGGGGEVAANSIIGPIADRTLDVGVTFFSGKLKPTDAGYAGNEPYFGSIDLQDYGDDDGDVSPDGSSHKRLGSMYMRVEQGGEPKITAEVGGDRDIAAAASSILVWSSNLEELPPDNAP